MVGQYQADDNEHGELLLVQAIFRHGARTPVFKYPGSPSHKVDYPEGMGALTAAGKEQMFHLGQILRNRYDNYLDGVLLKNINAQSSPARRCLETALAVLGGLFPPAETQVWSQDLKVAQHWQPIGVSSSDKNLGPLPCLEGQEMEKEAIKLEQNQKFLEEHQDFLDDFSKHVGLDPKRAWLMAVGVADSMVCERHYFGDSFQEPEWMEKLGSDAWDRLLRVRNFLFTRTFHLPASYFQLRTGPVMKEMFDNLNRVAKSGNQKQKNELYLYSTHDSLLAPLLHLFGFYKDQPGFGSAIILELRKDPKTQTPRVHLFYADGNKQFEIKPLPLHQSKVFSHLNSETSHCSLDHFTQALEDYLPEHNGTEDQTHNYYKM